jgi:mediator of RNA polymerase II transcription subunit 13, fungi type
MASKHTSSDHHNDPSGPVQYPPSLSSSDRLLSSVISLPDDPCIAYAVFTPSPSNASHPQDSIELARRKIIARNSSLSLFDSWLPAVHIHCESALYVFAIVSKVHSRQAQSNLNSLHLDGLQGKYFLCIHVFKSTLLWGLISN